MIEAVTVRRTILLLAIVAGVLLRVRIFTGLPRSLSVCTTDFSAFYAGGKLAGSLAMYSPSEVFAAEQAAMGCHMENLIFVKPPFYALLMEPLAQLPFLTALWIWRLAGVAAIGVFLWLWPGDRLAAAAGCAWYLPLAGNFTVGQDVALVLALVAGAYWCCKTGRPFWAGILLGLCAIKFHLFLLLPLLLWHRKLWRTALGGASVVLALVAVSFAVYGPGWWPRYLAALSDARMNPYPYNMVNLVGLFHYHAVWLAAAVVVAGLCWYAIARGTLELGLAAMLAGGVLIAPHNTVCDGVLFLPLLLMACRASSAAPTAAAEAGQPVARALGVFALAPIYAFLPSGVLQVVVMALLAWAAWEARPRGAAC
jgi:Glycosyltransferase family 87